MKKKGGKVGAELYCIFVENETLSRSSKDQEKCVVFLWKFSLLHGPRGRTAPKKIKKKGEKSSELGTRN